MITSRQDDLIPAQVPFKVPEKPQNPNHVQAKRMSMQELKALFKDLLVPRYVPEGYHLSYCSLRADQSQLVYEGPATPEQPPVFFLIDRFAGANPKVPEGFWKAVQVGNSEGLIVHGGWVVERDHNNQVATGWKPSSRTRVMLLRDGWVYLVVSVPGPAIDDATLLRVAESLAAA